MTTELRLVDPVNGNELRIIEHGGHVYFEALAKHGDTRVATMIRINRDIAMPSLRKLVLR
jgi:hypothetical protein